MGKDHSRDSALLKRLVRSLITAVFITVAVGWGGRYRNNYVTTGINADQLLELVIIPTLQHLNADSPAARNLIMGTIAHESMRAHYIKQVKGPAHGIAQMEPFTHDDIWRNYLAYRPERAAQLRALLPAFEGEIPDASHLIWNLQYAVAMARVHYMRVPDALPAADDIQALGEYWDKHYNKNPDKGFPHQFVEAYQSFVF